MPSWLNTANGLLILGAVTAIAHVVQAIAHPNTVAYKIADKFLAILPNAYDLFGKEPGQIAPAQLQAAKVAPVPSRQGPPNSP